MLFRHQIQKLIEDSVDPSGAARAIDSLLCDTTWRRGFGYFSQTETRRIIDISSSSSEAALNVCVALELKLRLKEHGWFDGDLELEHPMSIAMETDRIAFAAEGALISKSDRERMLKLHELARYWKLTPHTELPEHPFGMDLALTSIRCTSADFLRNMTRLSVFERIRGSEQWSWVARDLARALELGNILEAHNGLELDSEGLQRLQEQLGITSDFWCGEHVRWRPRPR
ncbi:hypothetical protein G6L37_34970 [Agrobacterium rubi]|nr:hypothetical protein [Agrobacterium rubi]NTF23772.1 hypothetical protein [Agrobacterium rubi]